ncbi:MAG TPA: DUF397 domain-containing protein [Actinophytocola sp.]|jgi:hypothetical protein|uniref:DUF397 domain-containing protein n=1 Tax=Actinophytocola sp. TaxID=1872138 RepID=UPI002DFEAB50|nr:DUF397 domain-containing protein [Actinophytocola sp.]
MNEAIKVSTVDLSALIWRKSSRSGSHTNDACVEVAFAGPAVAMRDSKHPAAALTFPAAGFATLLKVLA